MKHTNKELKKCARCSLLGHYKTAVAALIFSQLIVVIINVPMTQQGLAYGVLSSIVWGLVGTLIVSLLSYVFGAGLAYIHLQIARGQKTCFADLFYVFKNHPERYFGYALILTCLTVICYIPMVVLSFLLSSNVIIDWGSNDSTVLYLILAAASVGFSLALIYIVLALALTPYILLDNPSMRLLAATKLSRQLMRGNKWQLFRLEFSFIGWALFSLLSLGIGLLWVLPYMTQTITWFYLGFISDDPEDEA